MNKYKGKAEEYISKMGITEHSSEDGSIKDFASWLDSQEEKPKIVDECTPGSCPFAIADNSWPPRAWGMSPEGWEQARIRHKNHCKHNTCPNCGKNL